MFALYGATIVNSTGVAVLGTNGAHVWNNIVARNAGGDCYNEDNSDTLRPLVPVYVEDGCCGLVTPTGDPLLGLLQYNGGLTPTHALTASSEAIDPVGAP